MGEGQCLLGVDAGPYSTFPEGQMAQMDDEKAPVNHRRCEFAFEFEDEHAVGHEFPGDA